MLRTLRWPSRWASWQVGARLPSCVPLGPLKLPLSGMAPIYTLRSASPATMFDSPWWLSCCPGPAPPGIVPTTNPTSTAIFKALLCLKTRNSLILCPHPRATK